MAREEPSGMSSSLLLALPDPCLLTVLQCCAADEQRSLFSAARAHSRLQKAAVLALGSISVSCTGQQQADSALMFLGKHGKQVDSIRFEGKDQQCVFPRTPQHTIKLHQLPVSLQPSTLQFTGLGLQLQSSDCFRGVLGAAAGVAALKRLELNSCTLLDGNQGLAAALAQLPAGLEHLCIMSGETKSFPMRVLRHLQQLTYLELAKIQLEGCDDVSPTLKAMTRLVDLRLWKVEMEPHFFVSSSIGTVDMLSSAAHLTRLALSDCDFKPGALAHQTLLRYLDIRRCDFPVSKYPEAPLPELPNLQQMPHLTHLRLSADLCCFPADVFTALAANSNLQHLDISGCVVPQGVWQYILPHEGLPCLRVLNISYVKQQSSPWPPYTRSPQRLRYDPQFSPPQREAFWKSESKSALQPAPTPDSCRIVSCCPRLVSLEMQGLVGDADQLGSWMMSTKRDKLARQVPGLLSEVAHLRQQLSQQLLQQRQQQAAVLKAAQASQELMAQTAAVALLQQQLTAAQGAAAEAQQTVAALQSELAAARAAAALAGVAANGAAAQASDKQVQQDLPEPHAAAASADAARVAELEGMSESSWRNEKALVQ